MVHSAMLTLIAAAISIVYCLGFSLTFHALAFVTFAGVCFIGLPHGGLDYQLGTTWLSRQRHPLGNSKYLLSFFFLVAYLAVSGMVIVGWYAIPLFTVVAFFGLAGWHFGLEEEPTSAVFGGLDQCGVAARGSMVIWCTALFRPAEVSEILNQVLPTDLVTGSLLVSLVRACVPILVLLITWDLIRVARHTSKRDFITHITRLSVFAVMFGVCPVLLSFAVYFCGWHSIRGFAHLRAQVGGSIQDLIRRLAPTSVAAILLFAGGFLFYQSQLASSTAAIRTLFIGLSAVAIPHLLLHVVMDRSALKQGCDLNLIEPSPVQEAAAC